MTVVSGIYHYPIKGLSAQGLRGVRLEPGRPFPFDRILALARESRKVDTSNPQWAKKGLFIMLMLDEALAEVGTHLDVDTMLLTITGADGTTLLTANLEQEDGRAAVESFYHALVKTLRTRPILVRSHAGHFMDKPDNVLSLINLATLRSLEERWGYSLDPLRFRANIYVDGAPPWQEFDWIGGALRIGDALLRVDRRNGRCSAINVDPSRGLRDRDLPAALRAAFGHKDLGVYLLTEQGGTIAVGDVVSVSSGAAPSGATLRKMTEATTGARRFICRGCYYIYDEATAVPGSGLPSATLFSTLPKGWQCPDCGTDVSKFRPFAG